MVLSTVIFLGCLVACLAQNSKFAERFSWKQIDFAFPSDSARQAAITSGDFIKENNLPLGLDVWEDKLFITVPRWKAGVPSSLNYVSLKDTNRSPLLMPFPDWKTNTLPEKLKDGSTGTASKVISTFRVRVDACDRLWVIDTGLADIVGKAEQLTEPKLLIYNLLDDTLIREYHLNSTHVKENSFFANVIVDVTRSTCDNAFAYIPDLGSNAIIVYNFKENDSWRVTHHYFHFDPLSGNYNVGGVNFQWTDGVFGLALSAPSKKDGYRTMFFHSLSSTVEFAVCTKILQNSSIASDSYHDYKLVGNRGPNTQATASFIDETTGVLFYTQVNLNGIGCWNSQIPLSPETQLLVTSDNETFVFPNDLKIDRIGNLWVLTDRMPVFLFGSLSPEQVNYRVFVGAVKDIIKDTVCAAK